MNTVLRAAVVTLALATASNSASAQPPVPPPQPLAMGVPYVYQPGNPYWWQPVVPVPSPYPFGSSGPVFGRYTWDYGASYHAGLGYYTTSVPVYFYSYQYPTLPGRVWYGYGW
jgi:hypothetical protein